MADKFDAPEADESNGKWKHLVKHCLDLYEQFSGSEYRQKKIDEIKESYEAYDQVEKPTEDPWEGASAFNLPLTTISSDNIEPRMVAGLVGKKPYIKLEMENEQPQDQQTEMTQTWFNQELEDHVKIEGIASGVINCLLQEGTIYAMPYYDLDEETQKDFVYFDEVMQAVAPLIQKAQQAVAQGQAMAQQSQMVEGPDGAPTIDPNMSIPEEAQQMMLGGQQAIQEIQANIPPQIGGIVVDPQTGAPKTKDVTRKVFEGGKVKLVPFKDVYVADNVDEWEKAPVFRKIRKKYSELMEDVKTKPGFKINGKTVIGPWVCDFKGDETADKDEMSPDQEMDNVKETGNETIELIEASIDYVMRDDDKEEKEHKNYQSERLIAWIEPENRLLVRLLPLRELNFRNRHLLRRIRLFPRKGKSYGTSLYGKLKSIQKGLNKVFNISLDIAELIMIPYGFFDQTSGFERYAKGKDSKLALSPGGWYPLDNVKGIYTPNFNVRPDQMIPWLELFMMFWERILSIGDLQVGRQGEKGTTATETMAVIQEGNVKHNYQVNTIKEDFLEVIRTLYDLYYQYMPLDKTFLWNGQQVPIDRKMMSRGYKFRLTGSTDLSNKLIERREKESFYQLTAQDPSINPVKKSEELIKAYGHTDTTEWLAPGIGPIVEKLMTIPNAMQLVTKALQEAESIAKDMQDQEGGQ